MKKLFVLVLLLGLLFSSITNAATRLKLKSPAEAYEHINFVMGTGQSEQILGNTIRIVPLDLVRGHIDRYDLNLSNPDVRMYYVRTVGIGIRPVPHILGVKGIKLEMENLTENVLKVHWNESLIQIGKFGNMPFIKGMGFADAGKPDKTPDTIIQPKASVQVELYPSANVQRVYRVLGNQIEPISNDGTTRIMLNMKIEENGASNQYFYMTPCIDVPADFVELHKDDK